jgi:LmbE family N-acetylglucosaminyl deacetylase
MARPLTLVGCFAHPDDETWALAGSFALLVPKGVRGAVWTATRGDAGEIAPGTATRETLAAVREAEERAAMARVGVSDVEFADFADGQVDQADPTALVTAVAAFLEARQPDVVVTMEPDGVTGHPDHRAVTAAVKAAFAAHAARGRQPEPRLYYYGAPASELARWAKAGVAAGIDLPGADDPFGVPGTPDDQFTCWVDAAAVAEQVRQALGEHRTQSADPLWQVTVVGDLWRDTLASMAFIRVHPAPRPDEPPESSLADAFELGAAGG